MAFPFKENDDDADTDFAEKKKKKSDQHNVIPISLPTTCNLECKKCMLNNNFAKCVTCIIKLLGDHPHIHETLNLKEQDLL